MTAADRIETAARAICKERCAFYGEPPCWRADDEWWAAANDCDEPGCRAMARAAVAALEIEGGER